MSITQPVTPDTVDTSAEREASGNGHGTLEILEIVQAFDEAGIASSSCIVGVSALMYFGARRVRDCWDICVPTERFDAAIALLRNDAFSTICVDVSRANMPEISLLDTYPHFKRLGFENVFFRVVPAQAACLRAPCRTSSFEWSGMGLPYPKLHLFVQNAIDTRDAVALADVIDGMDLSERWGSANLDLMRQEDDDDDDDDARWAQWANARMEEMAKTTSADTFSHKIPTGGFDRKKTWQDSVARKQSRGGWKYPKNLYATRFRMHGSQDPRTKKRARV